jgi:putative transposase
MGLPRSTYYDAPAVKADDGEIVAAMATICDEFEAYGYRRVGAELRHRGMIVNSKKVRRLMREYDLQPKRRRRFVATTDSDHDCPIFPDLARDRIIDGPNQLWVADITYIAIATSFVYLAAVLDAWSRRVIGYAISRSIDARVAVAALKAAIEQGSHPKAAFITRIAVRNTLPRPTATSSPTMVWSVPWAGAAIPTTTPRLRAS